MQVTVVPSPCSSFGKTWETARPVDFDLSGPTGAQLITRYTKRALAIIRALTRWRTDLLGSPITIYTDHRTLEILMHRKTSPGTKLAGKNPGALRPQNQREDNMVVDAMSRLRTRWMTLLPYLLRHH